MPPDTPSPLLGHCDSRLKRLQALRERISELTYVSHFSRTRAVLQDLLDVCVDQDREIELLKRDLGDRHDSRA